MLIMLRLFSCAFWGWVRLQSRDWVQERLGGSSHLNVRLFIPAHVMIPGLWDRAPGWTLRWAWSLLKIFFLSPLAPLAYALSLSLKKKKKVWERERLGKGLETVSPDTEDVDESVDSGSVRGEEFGWRALWASLLPRDWSVTQDRCRRRTRKLQRESSVYSGNPLHPASPGWI